MVKNNKLLQARLSIFPDSCANILPMTNEERLARISEWMQRLRDELLALVTDDDTYWRFQKEVVQQNSRLITMKSPFFDLLDYAYLSATTSALRRLVEQQNSDKTNISLRILIAEIKEHQSTLNLPVTTDELDRHLAQLVNVEQRIKPYVDRAIAHIDRRGLAAALDPLKHRDLRTAIATSAEIFRHYYSLLVGSDLDLKVTYRDDFNIFAFPWADKRPSPFES